MRSADLPDSVRERPVLSALVGTTALALLARLYALGWRMAHQDEARVGTAVLDYVSSGQWEYNPVLHGPFVFQVNAPLFDLLGASDGIGRLVVALVGGLLPLSAWLFRERLRDVEVVALGAVLAANPFLLYYSRFMRSDVLVAAFCLVALGFAVRLLDSANPRYLHAAAVALALAFTTKENVLVYVGIWVGALALVVDYHVFVARARDADPIDVAARGVRTAARRAHRWRVHLAAAAVEFLFVIVLFYAPRPDVWHALGDPTTLPNVLGEATLGSWEKLWGQWVSGGGRSVDEYFRFLEEFVGMLRYGALPVVGFAGLGFLLDRYRPGGQRDFVAFATYWGAVSIPLYPLATDIMAPWLGVHVVVPLAVPAAVGLGFVYRHGKRALARNDRGGAGIAAAVLLLVGLQVGTTAVGAAYLGSQDPGPMVQYGQPDDHFKEQLGTVERVAAENEGTDVLFYSNHFENRLFRQPFPWYLGAMGAESETTSREGDLLRDRPPVVVAPSDDSAGISQTASDVEPYLDEYERIGKVAIVLEIPGNEVYAVIYVHESRLETGNA